MHYVRNWIILIGIGIGIYKKCMLEKNVGEFKNSSVIKNYLNTDII